MATIFYEVDIQNDFMNEDGALYVNGAEKLKPTIIRLSEHAAKTGVPIWASVDEHTGSEEDKDREGELARWGGPFPDHCMIGTPGAERIDGLQTPEFIFAKKTYDIFAEPNKLFETMLANDDIDEAIVYGVATDYCIVAAVVGMQNLGIQCHVVVDAIQGIDDLGTQQAHETMEKAGAKFVESEEILK